MASRLSITYMDFSKEKSVISVEGVDLNAANFDAQATAANALANAIAAVTLGTEVQLVQGNVGAGSLIPPANSAAQRENKWLVSYVDDSNPTRTLRSELPCADLEDETLFVEGTDLADLTNAEWVTFVAAFEAYVKAPFTGGDVTVMSIRFVGRRS